MTPDMRRQIQAAKLEQTCPDCGRTEAAGYYCSLCCRITGPEDWQPTKRSDAQRAAATGLARRDMAVLNAPEAPAPLSSDTPTLWEA